MAKRNAFTLIELMVSMALTMFIMVILSQAFITGLDVFRDLKALGDMEEQGRGASVLMRSDLAAPHFEGSRRLSDPNQDDMRYNSFLPAPSLVAAAAPAAAPKFTPLREGFLRIQKGTPTVEGMDVDSIPLARGDAQTELHLSVRLLGNRRENHFTFNNPALSTGKTTFNNHPTDARYQPNDGNTFTSQWAEVCYYLKPTGKTPAGVALFTLYRVQYPVVSDNSDPSVAAFKTPSDLVKSSDPLNPKAGRNWKADQSFVPGAALLCTNVTSFQVQALTLPEPTKNPTGDFIDLDFDSQLSTERIMALRVTIRLWDRTSGQSRQISIVQDM